MPRAWAEARPSMMGSSTRPTPPPIQWQCNQSELSKVWPPHLAEECVVHSERTRLREIFGLQRLRERTYTSAQMDTQWTSEIEADFAEWRKENTPTEFEHLVWEQDTSEQSEDGEPTLL